MLDSTREVKRLDRKDMLGVIEQLPKHLTEGLRRGKMSGLPKFSPKHIVVCGVGGSAIGGDLLREWLASLCDVSCEVQRSYSLPGYVSKESLVIVASYSGNTEETIGMFEDARRRRAKVAAVTSGGKLARMCKSSSVPLVKIPSGIVPRASIGYLFGAMLGVIERSGITAQDKQVEEAVRVMEGVSSRCRLSVETHDNPAKILAHEILNCVPVVIGYGLSSPMARRWANQINENGKSMAFFAELPELDHNAIVGWTKDPRSKGFSAVFLDHDGMDEAMRERVLMTKEMLGKHSPVYSTCAIGMSPLARMFSLLMIGDYTSAYLGVLRHEDPSTNEAIDDLKQALAKK